MDNLCNPFKNIYFKRGQVFELVKNSVQEGNPLILTYFNKHCYNIYQSDQEYQNLINGGIHHYVDGYGMWIVTKKILNHHEDIFNATELNYDLTHYLIEHKVEVIVIGGKFNLKQIQSSKLKIVQYFDGFNSFDYYNEELKKNNDGKAKFIIIGAGVPRQEKLAFSLQSEFGNLVIICVGNFLEYFFDSSKRVPQWLNNTGFEWCYRIIKEPKRLLLRYLIGIPKFILSVTFYYNKYRKTNNEIES